MMALTFEEIMPFAFILFLTLSSHVMAQYSEQPLPESNADLRSQTVLFSVEIPSDKKTYLLERTANQDFFLRLKYKDEETIKKIAGREAARLDRDFASRFLRCQYEIPSKDGECAVTLRLKMKGEGQEICEKDDKKSQEISAFLDELSKRF
jgi:hypothetical protein